VATVVEGIFKLRDTDAKASLSDVASSAKKAEDALGGAESQAKGTANALDDLADKGERASNSLKDAANNNDKFGDSAGKADRVASALAGSLGLVSPAAADAARGIADVAGGLEAVNLLGGSALRIMGPVAIAVGALALVYRELAKDAAAAAEAQKLAADEATRMQGLTNTTTRARIQAGVASGSIAKEDGSRQLAEMDAEALLGGDTRAALQELKEASAAMSALGAERTRLQAKQAQGIELSGAELLRLQQLAGAQAEAQQAVEIQARAYQIALQHQEAYAADLVTVGTAHTDTTAKVKAQTQATKDLTFEQQHLLDQLDQLAARNEGLDAVAAGGASAPTISAGLTGSDAWMMGDQVAASNDRTTAYLKDIADGIERGNDAAALAATVDGLNTGAAGLSAVTSGSLGGMLGATGDPVLAGVGAAVSALQELGDVGAEAVGDRIEAGFDSLAAGLEELPVLMADVLPQVLEEGFPKLVGALIDAAPALIAAQYELLLRLGKAVMLDIPVAIVAGIIDGVAQIIENAQAWLEGLLTGQGLKERIEDADWKDVATVGARIGLGIATLGTSEIIGRGIEASGRDIPLFHNGGLNDRERLAVVLAGERIVPPNTPGPGGQTSPSTGAALHFHGPVMGPESVDWVRRQLEQQYGPDGPAAALPTPWGAG
jgi:hypothetical protein